MLLATLNVADAGILEECRLSGTLVSDPAEFGNTYRVAIVWQSFTAESSDFCSDRIDTGSKIRIARHLYQDPGDPGKGASLNVIEYREENDFGHGMMRWRYFEKGIWGDDN